MLLSYLPSTFRGPTLFVLVAYSFLCHPFSLALIDLVVAYGSSIVLTPFMALSVCPPAVHTFRGKKLFLLHRGHSSSFFMCPLDSVSENASVYLEIDCFLLDES